MKIVYRYCRQCQRMVDRATHLHVVRVAEPLAIDPTVPQHLLDRLGAKLKAEGDAQLAANDPEAP